MKKNLEIFSAATVFYFCTLLLAFSIPLDTKIVPFFIIAFIISWIFYAISNRKTIRFSLNSTSILAVILYSIYAISMLYTSNTTRGTFDLEVKLSMLIFPLIFAFSEHHLFQKERYQHIMNAFVVGTIITTILCFAVAIYRCTTIFFTFEFFRYTYLSNSHHPTYLALFINLSIAIILSKMFQKWHTIGNLKKIGYSFLILYFIFFIFLLNSKAGILVMLLVILGIISIYTFRRKKIWIWLLFLFGFATSSFLTIRLVPSLNNRFAEMADSMTNIKNINQNTLNDNEQRILIWRYAADIISDNWLTGVGAGDVKSELNKTYIENGFNLGVEKNLNCHNQFLQTFVATGITGFIVLLLLLGYMLIHAFKKQNSILLAFFIIIAFNMLAESILETQSGTVFFGFFVAFLSIQKPD